ncbi:unnamed protein product [Orchesella dallaii]|uniref:F-box domain-containing protein n=1 Tax=Orchesella dallaii TaxID=48710 RepID=A0ABP1RYW7_9HEXA
MDGHGHVKRRKPSELLPMEIWSKIFEHLFKSSPWDLMSCSETCKEWDNLLEPRRSTYLMAEVFHPISKLLDLQEVLKCRLVCHSWNMAVNEVVSYSTTSIGFTINFRNNAASIKKIANIMTSSAVGGSINPFFSRSINLSISSGSRCNSRFQTAFRSLLARFGCEILSFQFNTFGISIPTQEQSMSIYKGFRYCLENLPNLMHLFVGGPILPNQNPDVRTLSYIETLLKEEPLPPLEYLSQLTMFYPNDLLEKGILLEYGNKIQDFSLEFGGYSLAQFLDSVAPIKMDNLTELWIRPVEMEEDILSMGSLKWPLTFLTIDFMVDTVKLETVFQAVSHFGDTLEILFVTVGGDDGNENWVMTATTPTQVLQQ